MTLLMMSSRQDTRRKETLEKLYSMREDLAVIATSEAEWAKYAREGLRKLHEAGYGVDVPGPGENLVDPGVDGSGRHCPSCGGGFDVGDAFCRRCGAELPGGSDD